MHEDLLKEQHLEAMRQWGNIQPPGPGNPRYPVDVDLSPLHGPNYRNLPAFLAGRDRVIIAEICEHLGIRYSRAEAVRIGRELRARAWRPALWRVDGKIVSGFHRPGFQKPRKVKEETGLVYSQFARLLAQAAMCQPPPPVGFWRRLLNLLTGGDR